MINTTFVLQMTTGLQLQDAIAVAADEEHSPSFSPGTQIGVLSKSK
jgi:hypothetical protein